MKDFVQGFILILLLIVATQKGIAFKCYVCNSQNTSHCSNKTPNNHFLKDSGEKKPIVCYELREIDPENGNTIVQRGFFSVSEITDLSQRCLKQERQAYSTIPTVIRPKQLAGKDRTSLSGQAWNNLQRTRDRRSTHTRTALNPNTLLKEEEESDEEQELVYQSATYNCTTCTTDGCNWKSASYEDDVDINEFVTTNSDEVVFITVRTTDILYTTSRSIKICGDFVYILYFTLVTIIGLVF